jgi:hypothetical protein
MENIKEYKYKDLIFTPVKRTLKFHKENYHFIKEIQEYFTNKEIPQDELFWEYIHTEDNIRKIITKFLDGETDKIVIEVETDEDYTELITLVTQVLTDFFSSYTKTMTMRKQ